MVVASIHESQTDLELEPPSYENATSPSNQNNSENDVQAKTGIDREAYWQKVRLVANLIPTTLDHVSDILVLIQLLNLNRISLFIIGLAIDFLPGPIAVYQFFLLGYGWKSLLLILHPVNAYLHTFLQITNSKYGGEFSAKVIAYAHDCQGLLESPLQVIFTLTLVALGLLPTPREESTKSSLTIYNSFGQAISVSFWPSLSIALSFLSIIVNCARTINVMNFKAGKYLREVKSNLKRIFGWLLFLASTILFRIQIWVLLCSFMAEFVLIVVAIIFLVNFMILIKTQRTLKVDPVLASIYSLAFPVTYLRSILDNDELSADKRKLKKMYKLLTISGSLVLLCAMYVVTYLVQTGKSEHSPDTHIRTDLFIPIVITSSILGFISIVSTFILSSKEIRKIIPNRNSTTVSIVVRVVLFFCVFAVFAVPFVVQRKEIRTTFNVTKVCGQNANFSFKGFLRNIETIKRSGEVHHCKDDPGDPDSLGCYEGIKIFKDPANPASPHPEFETDRPAIFIKNRNGNETESLKLDFDNTCRKNRFVVCYFTAYGHYTGFKPSDIDPSLCSHIIFVYNTLDKETLLLTPSDNKETIEEKNLEIMVSSLRRGTDVQILFSVGGYDHPDEPFSRLVSNETSRKVFVENSIKFLKRNGFDGLDMYWYSPVYWNDDNRSNEPDRQNFLNFIKVTYAAFKKENLLLTTEVSALTYILDVAFDLEEMSQHVDLINLVSWDLTGYWSGITGMGNPISRRDRGDCFSLDCAVEHLLNKKVPKEKIIVGIQLYANTFKLVDPKQNTVKQSVSGPGESEFPNQEPASLSYTQICKRVKFDGWQIGHTANQGSYITKDRDWASFNDVVDVADKAEWIVEQDLGGASVFLLHHDDFEDSCRCEKFPLIKTLNRYFRRNTVEKADHNCSLFVM